MFVCGIYQGRIYIVNECTIYFLLRKKWMKCWCVLNELLRMYEHCNIGQILCFMCL